jgi:hypothetical protein
MSSALSFTFRPSLIPDQYQAAFLTRFFQLVLDYETLTAPAPPSPPADAVPQPSSFVPVQGDGADGETAPATASVKPPRKNPWAGLTPEQRADRLAAMKRGRAARAASAEQQRRVSEDSLNVPPTETGPALSLGPSPGGGQVAEPEPAPVLATSEDAASDSSSAKRARKNPWAGLTPEQHAAKVLALKLARDAKRAERAAAAATTGV